MVTHHDNHLQALNRGGIFQVRAGKPHSYGHDLICSPHLFSNLGEASWLMNSEAVAISTFLCVNDYVPMLWDFEGSSFSGRGTYPLGAGRCWRGWRSGIEIENDQLVL